MPGARAGSGAPGEGADRVRTASAGNGAAAGRIVTAGLCVRADDEMFSDIYKIREIADGLCLEVEGKVSRRAAAAWRQGGASSGFRRSPAQDCAILSSASWRRRLFRLGFF